MEAGQVLTYEWFAVDGCQVERLTYPGCDIDPRQVFTCPQHRGFPGIRALLLKQRHQVAHDRSRAGWPRRGECAFIHLPPTIALMHPLSPETEPLSGCRHLLVCRQF